VIDAVPETIMLAAESAWRILHAEHTHMRELLASIGGALASGDWRGPGPQLASLRQVLETLQAFDRATHRPKGLVLLASLRGRSSDADDLLDQLQLERERCDQLLSQICTLLDALEQGEADVANDLESLLEQHRDLMLSHLDLEDQALHSHTALLLTPDEWSNVVSSISKVVQATRAQSRRGSS
jgi:hemerythrin-like domain-containing protein